MKTKTIKILAAVISPFIFALPFFAFATATSGITNPLGSISSIPAFISTILGYVVKVGGIVAIFAFIWAGYLFVVAQGKPAELEKAKNVFINTCIGVAILLGAQLIASIIVGTLKSLS